MMTPTRAQLPFNVDSPWRLGVADAATFPPDDDPRHVAIAALPRPGAMWANYDTWSHPVTQAKATDPLVTVTDLDHGGAKVQTRIPIDARIAAGDDAHMHIIAPDKKTVAEHWATKRLPDGNYTCRRREVVNLSSNGLDRGCRAYGGSAIGGLIRGWEIKAGRINHPLAIALRQTQMRPVWVWPATTEDGGHRYAGPVPMGTYLAIPRTFDLASLGIRSKAALMVARACQEFGVYVTDSSGSACFYVEDDGDPVTAAWHNELIGPRWSATDLPPIFRALRVVTNNSKATPNGGSPAQRRLH